MTNCPCGWYAIVALLHSTMCCNVLLLCLNISELNAPIFVSKTHRDEQASDLPDLVRPTEIKGSSTFINSCVAPGHHVYSRQWPFLFARPCDVNTTCCSGTPAQGLSRILRWRKTNCSHCPRRSDHVHRPNLSFDAASPKSINSMGFFSLEAPAHQSSLPLTTRTPQRLDTMKFVFAALAVVLAPALASARTFTIYNNCGGLTVWPAVSLYLYSFLHSSNASAC